MFSKLGFQNKIFMIFIGLFIVILVSFAVYLYMYMKSTLVHTEQTSLAPATQKISDQIDMMYKQLDYAALGFTYNQQNSETMQEMNNNPGLGSTDLLVAQSKLIHNLSSIYNVVSDLFKVIIFVPDRNIFFSYIRDENLVKHVPLPYSSPASMDQVFRKNKLFAALPAHPDYWSTKPETVVSVVRKFSTPYDSNFGLIQLDLPYKSLEEICTLDKNGTMKQVLLFDEAGRLIYPYSADPESDWQERAKPLSDIVISGGPPSGELRLGDHDMLYNAYTSAYTGWTTVITDDETFFLKNLNNYRTLLITVSLAILLIVVLVYYIIIRKLLSPLKQLTRTVRSVSLSNLHAGTPLLEGNEYNEFKLLSRSFDRMIDKLKDSINTEYEGRIREMEAHYSALQAQINPHFLFNTLNVIAAHCEDTDSDTAADMCYRLSEMMRYTASSASRLTTIGEEVRYSEDYLELVKLHYDDSLTYRIDMPEAMLSIPMPRLSLQPFVENSINHGFDKTLPPWRIHIRGAWVSSSDWQMVIEDNGAGMDPSDRERIRAKLAEYRRNAEHGNMLSNLQVSGMGVVNTYVRLSIHFGNAFYMDFAEGKGSGLKVTFGVKAPSEEVIP